MRSCLTSVLAMLGDLVAMYRIVLGSREQGAGSEDVTLVPGTVPGTSYQQAAVILLELKL